MSRDTPSVVTTEFRGETAQLVLCMDLETGATPANLRVTSYDGPVAIGGVTFTPRPLAVEETLIDDQGEPARMTVRLGDADDTWRTLLAAGAEFRNRRVRMYRTGAAAIAAGAAATDTIRDDWYVETWRRAQGAVELQLRSMLGILTIEVPRRTVTRREYPGIPDVNRL